MKKFLAIVLALAFVLGYASIASADFSIAGQFVVKYKTDDSLTEDLADDWDLDAIGDSRFELTLKGTYGQASGDIKFRFNMTANDTATLKSEARTANMFYKFSDAFSLGFTYDQTGDPEIYQSPICDNFEWEYRDFNGNGTNMVAKIAAGDFAATILWDMYDEEELKFAAGGTFNLDPIAIAAVINYGTYKDLGGTVNLMPEEFQLVASVTYALSDELKLGGEVYYNSLIDDSTVVGFGANYKSDVLKAVGGVYVLVDETDYMGYDFEVEYTGVDQFKFYAYYYNNVDFPMFAWIGCDETSFLWEDSYEVGVTYYLDEKDMSWVDFAIVHTDKYFVEMEFGIKF